MTSAIVSFSAMAVAGREVSALHDTFEIKVVRSAFGFALVLAVTAAGSAVFFALTSALRLAAASFVMPIDFVRLPLIAVIAAVLYTEPLDPFVLLGGTIIFFGACLNIRAELRHANTASNAAS